MKSHYVVAVFVFFASGLVAQVTLPASSPGNQIHSDSNEPIWLTGKVIVEGGSAPADPVTVVLRCAGQERARVSSSNRGDFSLTFNASENFGDGKLARHASFNAGSACDLSVDSPDYISKNLQLFSEMARGPNQVGTIVLYPRTAALGASISVTSLAAPDKAKKAFEKGQEQERKGKFQAACNFFRHAVEVYPHYAIAWLELGRAQIKQNDFSSAQQSFYEATSQDSRLVGGYEGLAEVALQQNHWKDLANSTGKILEMFPNNAKVWFLNSAANFNLGDTARAETGAVRGLHLDSSHQVPQLEYLYGIILARRAEYTEAIDHLQTYLRMSPKAEDAKQATQALQTVQKLAASAKSGAPPQP